MRVRRNVSFEHACRSATYRCASTAHATQVRRPPSSARLHAGALTVRSVFVSRAHRKSVASPTGWLGPACVQSSALQPRLHCGRHHDGASPRLRGASLRCSCCNRVSLASPAQLLGYSVQEPLREPSSFESRSLGLRMHTCILTASGCTPATSRSWFTFRLLASSTLSGSTCKDSRAPSRCHRLVRLLGWSVLSLLPSRLLPATRALYGYTYPLSIRFHNDDPLSPQTIALQRFRGTPFQDRCIATVSRHRLWHHIPLHPCHSVARNRCNATTSLTVPNVTIFT